MKDAQRILEVGNAIVTARGVVSGVALSIVFCVFTVLLPGSSGGTMAQRRPPRRPARPAAAPKGGIDYSKFSHATKKHQDACNTCHKSPTKNWLKVRKFPDIADYPDHDTCVSCHRPQFFVGAKPPICTVCHTKVSPRDEERFAFRKPGGLYQFKIEFPHDKHQDVIASLRGFPKPDKPARFVRASLTFSAHAADDKTKTYNNCEICHTTPTKLPPPPPAGWADSFVPEAATFKGVPVGHASCFNCHWKSQAPKGDDCAGCHKLAAPYLPVTVPERISMKFKHSREQHVAECTVCHINITKAADLRGLKPDVPITSCTECHNKDGLRLDVSSELDAVDKNRQFVCVYCHTSDVGRRDAPAGHYLIAGRQPIKRKDVK